MREQHATTRACSRLSTKVEGTPAVQGSTQNGPGAPLLLIMTWTNCGDTVVDAEVKTMFILNTKRPTVQLFVKLLSTPQYSLIDAQVIIKFVYIFSLLLQSFFLPSPRTFFFYFVNLFKLKGKKATQNKLFFPVLFLLVPAIKIAPSISSKYSLFGVFLFTFLFFCFFFTAHLKCLGDFRTFL